jgi:hypothetical protein
LSVDGDIGAVEWGWVIVCDCWCDTDEDDYDDYADVVVDRWW